MKNRIQRTNAIGFSEWIHMPESGFVIVETFGTMVILLRKRMSCTFVSTIVYASLLNQNRMIVMSHEPRRQLAFCWY